MVDRIVQFQVAVQGHAPLTFSGILKRDEKGVFDMDVREITEPPWDEWQMAAFEVWAMASPAMLDAVRGKKPA